MTNENENGGDAARTQSQPATEGGGTSSGGGDDNNLATLIYILGIFTGFVGPLIIWLIKKDESKAVDHAGKEVLNWMILVVIAWIVGAITVVFVIGLIILPAVGICNVIFMIIGAVKTSKGEMYTFPFSLRLLK